MKKIQVSKATMQTQTTLLITIVTTLGKISTSAFHCGSSQQRWDEKWDDASLAEILGSQMTGSEKRSSQQSQRTLVGSNLSVMEPHHIRKTVNIF